MRMPAQPRYEDFVPRFMRSLFGPGDRVVLASLGPGGKWRDEPFARDDAIQALLQLKDDANMYFRASALDGSGGYEKGNCVRIGAFFLDIDYGKAGHSKPSPFKTLEDAVGYLLTMPIKASAAWHTGHGVQACYLLREPYAFLLGGGDALSLMRYERVSRKLSGMAKADSTYTPEHPFRVPLTLNDKREKDPGLPVVRGEVLWMDEARRYSFEEIEAAVAGYGLEEHLAEEQKKAEASAQDDAEDDEPGDAGGKDVPYAELPEDIQAQIENVDGDRSGAMFSAIAKMLRLGYSDGTILDAISHGFDFRKKYGARLKAEVDRCIGKVRSGKAGRYVYGSDVAPPIETHNEAVEIRLDGCAALPQALEEMLGRYGKACDEGRGIKLSQRVLDAARFHEHMYRSQAAGVLESPCGGGKSTWAHAHIALNGREDNRYLYVLETVDSLYKAADMLEKLANVPVGRSHGFNPEKCKALCGVEHAWRECLPKDPRSACRTCAKKAICPFHNRAEEQKKPIVCMTHEGLIRALEEGAELLKGANILVDEDLKPYTTWDVSLEDLRQLRRCVPDVPLDDFLPCGSFACGPELARYGVPDGADVFASRNYVYSSEQETAALGPVCAELRRALAISMDGNPFTGGVKADHERAKSTLASLLNFFRPSKAQDAFYAYHEKHGKDGIQYTLKRTRFSLEMPRGYRKFWMLNASAQLSPYPYPDNLPVYACPDLPDNSHLVKLHVVRGNPMKSKLQENIWLSNIPMWLGPRMRPEKHGDVLVATNKESGLLDDIKAKVLAALPDAKIVHLTRGRIKGSNDAGGCTLAFISGMSVFTTIDDCALHAALLLRRTFPDQPHIFRDGALNMPDGRFAIPAMNQYYALRALDEIYQTVWRTAVRNDKPVDAIVAIPALEWLLALWRTVMPHYRIGETLQDVRSELTQSLEKDESVLSFIATGPWLEHLSQLINLPPGTEVKKRKIAEMLGYTGKDPWKYNRKRIMRLLAPFFEDGSTNRVLRRKNT